jgi:chromosome segregation protein
MTLLGLIEAAEQGRKVAADRLAEAEGAQAAAAKALKAADAALHEMREERVRLEGGLAQADAALAALALRSRERLDCTPDRALELAEHDPSAELPDRAAIETKLDRLIRERENIGPVNLRAEAEAAELDQQITGLQTERSDLVAAIARLRQGIASLNREGRERLLAAFEQVNSHFADLFVRLFGGGRAHLALTESEDPLEAGLEIMASPPGKRLQVMSLLSGGEQALTALALLFAVFLTNPAPICVLDEVDAPLDDANVDRFCTLVEDIAKSSETRFLIITHHRLTMARMDRLFGVTMAERGVSQLVSVDLQRAEKLAATA